VKRKDFIQYLEMNQCYFLREGGSHTIYKNIQNGKKSAIPRHSEIKKVVVMSICKALEIKNPFN